MKIFHNGSASSRRITQAFSLTETVMAVGISTMVFGAIISGYVQSARTAEWSAHMLAAQSLAMAKLEQTRAARWDPTAVPVVDDLINANFAPEVRVLDVPRAGTNFVYATNYTSITTISNTSPLRQIRIRCTWCFTNGRLYTNDIVTYRGPDA